MSQAFADLQLIDPVFSPPNFTTATRPTCPSANGCFGYNTGSKKLEYWDGSNWVPISVAASGSAQTQNWEPNTVYRKDQLIIGGAYNDLLLRVERDTTSAAEFWQDVNSPDFTTINIAQAPTGWLKGGSVTLIGGDINVTAGQGIISNYSGGRLLPLIKIVEWADVTNQALGAAPSGLSTVYVDPSGIVKNFDGFPSVDFRNANIVLAVIDRNSGYVQSKKTYVTNPISQLRELYAFFGAMTDKLTLVGNASRTIARTAYTMLLFGVEADTNINSPNTRNFNALSPVPFIKATRAGMNYTTTTDITTCCYNSAASTMTQLTNNRFGYVRFYLDGNGAMATLYSQTQFITQADADAAIFTDSLIVPDVLDQTYVWVGYMSYAKDDGDLSNNNIHTCEPFGCSTSKRGGSGGGGGDVYGPNASTDNAPALYSGLTGKTLKAAPYSLPNVAPTAGQVLKATSSSDIAWASDNTNTGDVIGPASSALGEVSFFNNATGKLITSSDTFKFTNTTETNLSLSSKTGDDVSLTLTSISGAESASIKLVMPAYIDPASSDNYTITLPTKAPQSAGKILEADANGKLTWITTPLGNVLNVGTPADKAPALYSGTSGDTITPAPYTFPDTAPAVGQVLQATSTSEAVWETPKVYGDMYGPNSSIDKEIAVFAGITGKLIESTGVSVADLQTGIASKTTGPATSTSNTMAIYTDTSGKLLGSTPYVVPIINGIAGQVLTTNGAGTSVWAAAPAGINPWVTNKTFKAGDYVNYNNGLYLALADNSGADFRAQYLLGNWSAVGPMTPRYVAINNLATNTTVPGTSFSGAEYATIQLEIYIRRVKGADTRLSKRLVNLMYDGTNWTLFETDSTIIKGMPDGVTFTATSVGDVVTLKFSASDMGAGYDNTWSYMEYFVKPLFRGGV